MRSPCPFIPRSVARRDTELDLVEARSAGRFTEIEPVLLVAQAQCDRRAHVPAHARADVVDELVDAARVLVRAAVVPPPRIPPAGGLRRRIRNVGVDEAPADGGRYV